MCGIPPGLVLYWCLGSKGADAALEARVSKLEGAYEQVDRRLDDLSRSVDSLRAEMSSLRTEINSRFNNLYILLGGSWVTVMIAIIGLYVKS